MYGPTYLTAISLAFFALVATVPNAFAEDQPLTDASRPVPGVSDEELDAERGGEIVPISDATLTATLEDNTISGSVTGGNSVGGEAFTGATGFFTVIQNSGNQVIIQDSTIINVTVE